MNKQEKFISSEDLKKVALEIDKHDENQELKIKDDLKVFKANFDPLQPKVPRNIVLLAIFLTLLGLGLIIAGFVEYSKYNDANKCIAYWIIGAFSAIPGVFYVGKIIKYWRSQNDEEKRDIISEMPEWN